MELKDLLDVVIGISWIDCFTFSLEGTGPNSFLIKVGPLKVRVVNGRAEAICRNIKEEIGSPDELSRKVFELRKRCNLSTLCSSSGGRVKVTVVEGIEEIPTGIFNDLRLGLETVYKKRVQLFTGSLDSSDTIYLLKAVRTKGDLILQLFNPKARAFWHVGLNELKSNILDLTLGK